MSAHARPALPVIHAPQELRPYQREAVSAVQSAWASGVNAPLVAMATGGGKTTVMAQLLKEQIDPYTQRALCIGHTKEIVEQIYARVENQFAGQLNQLYGKHLANGIGMVMGAQDDPDARIVIATRQSLHARRLPRLLETGCFDVLVIDEAHHALGDNTYGAIINTLKKKNRALKVVGFTATPKRTDKKALKSIFDDIVYSWLIPDGITGGYLVPTTRVKVHTKVNLSNVKTVSGDYSQSALVSVLKTSNWLPLSIQAYQEHIASSNRQCLAFLPSVDMSKEFAKGLRDVGIAAAHVDGETDKAERQSILRDYVSGNLQCVSNMAVLTEGFDAPCTGAIFLARPTRSQTLFTQIVGRGLRPFPTKLDCILLDMAVLDTKALETGTLLGKTIQCQQCKAEYYAGFDCCPRCGAVPVKEKAERATTIGGLGVEDEKHLGAELVAHYESVFEKAFSAWFVGKEGYLTASMGWDGGALIIMPPILDEQYRLGRIQKDSSMPIRLLGMSTDLAELIAEAEGYIKKQTSSRDQVSLAKEAKWRGEPASEAQKGLLRSLEVPFPDNLSRGLAAQMITHHLNIKRALKEAWSV